MQWHTCFPQFNDFNINTMQFTLYYYKFSKAEVCDPVKQENTRSAALFVLSLPGSDSAGLFSLSKRLNTLAAYQNLLLVPLSLSMEDRLKLTEG